MRGRAADQRRAWHRRDLRAERQVGPVNVAGLNWKPEKVRHGPGPGMVIGLRVRHARAGRQDPDELGMVRVKPTDAFGDKLQRVDLFAESG